MEYRLIKTLDFEASRIGLGTWAMGGMMWGGTDEQESIAAIHAALDQGINVIDTAPAYGFGTAEKIVARGLAGTGKRDEVMIVTKAGIEPKNGDTFRNASRQRLLKEIDDSLERLQTDRIDLYLVHWPDPNVPQEETAEAMNTLFKAGKIRAVGVSNYDPRQMDQFRAVAPLQAVEPPYNLFEREIERDVLPYCKNHDIAILGYGVLCRGLLSGKMASDREFSGDDLRQVDPKFQSPKLEQYLTAVDLLDDFALRNYGRRVIDLAVRWVLDQDIDIALWGVRRPEQLKTVNQAMGWSLNDEAKAEIDRIIKASIKAPVGPEFMAPPAAK
jgi:aryl-alcohol dehydrogenase-like predicted oxidoreductase